MKTTVQGLATQLGVERDSAYHLMKYLEDRKLAVKTGETAKPEGKSKGKGADIYELNPMDVVGHFSEAMNKLHG